MGRKPDAARIERRLRAAGFNDDQRAVSEIIGSMLLIGITVLLVGGLAVLVLSVKPPADPLHADISMLVTRGPDGEWGTADETLRVQHKGGEAIPKEGLSISIDVGGTTTTYSGSGLTGTAFDDGELTIGELWSVTLTVAVDQSVDVEMILSGKENSSIITSSRIRSGGSCEPDVTAPSVDEWTQSPADVTATTSGGVTVTVKLIDSCTGVDESTNPHLEFRVNDGTDPAFTDLGAMTSAGSRQWQATIPDQTWFSLIGQSLQYRVTGMTDNEGNSATSPFQSDVIQFSGTSTYTSGNTAVAGTVTNFGNAQNDADSGAFSTLTEVSGVPAAPYYATGASGSGGTGSAGNADGAPDDTYYIIDGRGDSITVTPIDITGGSGTISKVEMVFEGHYESTRVDDRIDLSANAGSGFTAVLNDYVPTAGSSGDDSQRTVDITGLRGSWDWTNVQDLQLRATYDKVAATDAMTVHVDAMWVVVTVSSSTDLNVELSFPSLPLAATHVLELEYSVTEDDFHVEVWNGVSWTQRGTTLDQSGFTIWVYQLTLAEVTASGGTPLIRIVDDSGASNQGSVRLDYVKVVSG